MAAVSSDKLKKIEEFIWEIPQNFNPKMKVAVRIYASEEILAAINEDRSFEQLCNAATLPSVYKYVLGMPDIHEGYGLPIGGVMATEIAREGLISPGSVGYDINCGVRLLLTRFDINFIKDKLEDLIETLFRTIPSGLGAGGAIRLNQTEIDEILNTGLEWMLKKKFALSQDLNYSENGGKMTEANSDKVSPRAKQRGLNQLGTLGSGNHFLEISKVEEIYDEESAIKLGLKKEQIVILVHTGSRGLGHQVCTDYVQKILNSPEIVEVPDRELAACPFDSQLGQDYFQAMAAAANFAWSNRQMITDFIRGVFEKKFNEPKENVKLLYDVAHNIAKVEEYEGKKLLVHRKGATRAFGAGNSQLPEEYRSLGQPVLIPGSMGSASYVLLGTKKAEEKTFGSTCHGAGRLMSRGQAKRQISADELINQLNEKGITIRSYSKAGIVEEMPAAYKNIDEVVRVVDSAGISKKIAKLVPLGVIKG